MCKPNVNYNKYGNKSRNCKKPRRDFKQNAKVKNNKQRAAMAHVKVNLAIFADKMMLVSDTMSHLTSNVQKVINIENASVPIRLAGSSRNTVIARRTREVN